MTTSERFLARRARAWSPMDAARPFAPPRSMSGARLKVPRRYTAGAESLSRPAPRIVGESFEAAIATGRASRRSAGQCCRQRRKCAAMLAADTSGASRAAKWPPLSISVQRRMLNRADTAAPARLLRDVGEIP
jgi:hypothetical protein